MKKEKKEELVELKKIEELNKKKKDIPEEVMKLMRKKVFVNILRAIAIFLYFIALNFTFSKLTQNNLTNCLEIVSGILLLTSLVEFERAYKKDSGVIAISAIELLVLAMHALSIMHICTLLRYDERIYVLTSSYIFAIYYVLKSIIAYSIMKKQYIKSLNDISDIVKKDEPVKKEATKRKTTKTKKVDDTEIEITPAKKTTRKKSTGTKTTTAKSKSTTTKVKKVEKNEDVEEKKTVKKKTTSTKPKSARGTRRTTTKKVETEIEAESKPKTRTSTTKKAGTTKTSTTKKKIGTTTKKKTTTKSKKEVEVND